MNSQQTTQLCAEPKRRSNVPRIIAIALAAALVGLLMYAHKMQTDRIMASVPAFRQNWDPHRPYLVREGLYYLSQQCLDAGALNDPRFSTANGEAELFPVKDLSDSIFPTTHGTMYLYAKCYGLRDGAFFLAASDH